MAKGRENGFERLVTGTARPKPITMGLNAGLPGGFESRLDQTLQRSICPHGNPPRSVLRGARFRNPRPPHWLHPLPNSQPLSQREALGESQGFYALDPCGLLASVSLGHLPHGSAPGGAGV